MSKSVGVVSIHDPERASYKTYLIGFGLSLLCTMVAYLLTVNHALSRNWALAIVIATLAIIQAVTQLTLFLHLGKEAKPKLKLTVFAFMLMVVLILIGGSIWIMHNLNNRMMTQTQINNYMEQQDDGGL
jgi:cytochrome o ubiquinol oxidase operon protein cyoD